MAANYITRGLGEERTKGSMQDQVSLTVPGKGMRVREALERYKAGTLEERTLGYYYDAYDFPDEAEVPDFTRMTRIEKLKLLQEKRKQVQEFIKQAQNGSSNETTEGTTTTGEGIPEGGI